MLIQILLIQSILPLGTQVACYNIILYCADSYPGIHVHGPWTCATCTQCTRRYCNIGNTIYSMLPVPWNISNTRHVYTCTYTVLYILLYVHVCVYTWTYSSTVNRWYLVLLQQVPVLHTVLLASSYMYCINSTRVHVYSSVQVVYLVRVYRQDCVAFGGKCCLLRTTQACRGSKHDTCFLFFIFYFLLALASPIFSSAGLPVLRPGTRVYQSTGTGTNIS